MTIKVWDIASGKQLFTLQGHSNLIYSLALLANGWLASSSADKTIKLWDLEEEKEVKTLEGHTGGVVSVKALKNGNLVSYSHDDTMKLWDPYLSENNHLSTIKGHGNKHFTNSLFGVLSNEFLVTCSFNDGDLLDDEEISVAFGACLDSFSISLSSNDEESEEDR